jgi:hypothetical protein
MMRFRAVLDDPGDLNQERPIGILTNSRRDITEWALGNNESSGILAKAVSQDASVNVYQISEILIETIRKPKKEERKP